MQIVGLRFFGDPYRIALVGKRGTASGGVFLVYEFHYGLGGGAGEKNFCDAGLLQGRDVGAGDDAADQDGYLAHAFFFQESH